MTFGASARDAEELVRRLRAEVGGAVRFDAGTRALYATDASNYEQTPLGVVEPRDTDDVLAVIAACRAVGAPILPRGAGTSLAGQACNVAVILDFTKHMNQVLEVDPVLRVARVQPGLVLDRLQEAVGQDHLAFGPDPATHGWCTLGGMIGNNACGAHSLKHGKTADHVMAVDVATYRGSRLCLSGTGWGTPVRGAGDGSQTSIPAALAELAADAAPRVRAGFPAIPRRVSGYNLDALLPEAGPFPARSLVGSEGTCAVLLEATVGLVDAPGPRALAVLGFPDIASAADAVPAALTHSPVAIEGIEGRLLAAAGGMPGVALGGGLLIVEVEGATASAAASAAGRLAADRNLGAASARVVAAPSEQAALWRAREAALGSASRALGNRSTWPGWEDSAVAPHVLGRYLRELRKLLQAYGLDAALYGHFGEGCVHGRATFELRTANGVAQFRSFIQDAARLVVAHGGCLSGEHGDGQARGELLEMQFGAGLMDDFRRFKAIWDPDGRLNPGKMIDARPLDADLRSYRPEARPRDADVRSNRTAAVNFGAVAAGAAACVGVGRCRKQHPGTMCPSFMATGDEPNSTRGRARLLFALTTGRLPADGRRAVDEALELCLGCKACRTECPAGVDMAALKSAYHARRWAARPRPRFTVLASFLPWLLRVPRPIRAFAAPVLAVPAIGHAVGRLAGMAHGSAPPIPAARSFVEALGRPAKSAPRKLHLKRSTRERVGPSNGPSGIASGELRVVDAGYFRVAAATGDTGAATIVLWPDTMHNFFAPQALEAACRLLVSRGERVAVPRVSVCCGRTLVDSGFTKQAQGTLLEAARVLSEPLVHELPVIVLEPSCLSMFRDEIAVQHGTDAASVRRRAVGLAEFLTARGAPGAAEPGPDLGAVAFGTLPESLGAVRSVLLHPHCHQQALWGCSADEKALGNAGFVVTRAPDGCCGMAGAFGLSPRTAAVGRAVGELGLLPAIRDLGEPTVIVADGFSCREQVRRQTGRHAVHLAQALWPGPPTMGNDR